MGQDIDKRADLRSGQAGQVKKSLLICLVLVVCIATTAVYWPVLSANALSFDDAQYFTKNPLVKNPSWSSAKQFLTEVLEPSTVRGSYHPLSMISLMLDYALGAREGNLMPFHRTSLILHVANTALVILVLYQLFGRAWASAGAGLIFGIHPMTVECVAWVTDRKTVLAAFFALLCLLFYLRFVQSRDKKVYAVSLVMYVLALLSKPTAVPIPAVMLLMDYWPLGRFKWKMIYEKLPFIVLGGTSAIITYISHMKTAGISVAYKGGIGESILILCHNIIFYLYKVICPVNLSSYYAFPRPIDLSAPIVVWGVIGTCILIPLLIYSLRWTRSLFVGWLVFFVAIFPTLGVIGFSFGIASDKYAYLPSIGLLMMLTWFLSKVSFSGDLGKRTLRGIIIGLIVLILAGAETSATRGYLSQWHDTDRLLTYMLRMDPDAPPVHNMLGILQANEGKYDKAIEHYDQAIKGWSEYPAAYHNLGNAHRNQGNYDLAIGYYRKAVELKADDAEAHNDLGVCLAKKGSLEDAVDHFRNALRIKGDSAEIYHNLGNALIFQGKLDEGIEQLQKTLEINNDNFEALNRPVVHKMVADVFYKQGKYDEAIEEYNEALSLEPKMLAVLNSLAEVYLAKGNMAQAVGSWQRAIEIKPKWPEVLNNLAWCKSVYSGSSFYDPSQAVEHSEKACELTDHKNADFLDTLSIAYAADGRFSDAVDTANKALGLANDAGQEQVAGQILEHLKLFEAGKSYTEDIDK